MYGRIERVPRKRSFSGTRMILVGFLLLIVVGLVAFLILNPRQAEPVEIPVLFPTDEPLPLLESLPLGDYQVFAVANLDDGGTGINIKIQSGASWVRLPGYKPEFTAFQKGCLLRVSAEGMTLIMPRKDSLSCSTP